MQKIWNSKFPISISLLVLILITLPFIIGALSGPPEHVFNGLLINPMDGNSYLAKMFQGWDGEWRFRLPFTAEPGEGAYLFLFYLGLGHIARLLNLPLVLVFHLARLIASVLLLWSLWLFWGAIFNDQRVRKLAFALAALGSGLGWLLVPLGAFTADFWVTETYPFLSTYANPHFPLGLALVLWLLRQTIKLNFGWKTLIYSALATLFLSIINPFGVVITLIVLSGYYLWSIKTKSQPNVVLKLALTVATFGLPLLAYDNWVAWTDPAFAGWNAQNLTPSPPLWDLLISLSPALLFGIWGVIVWIKSIRLQGDNPITILVIWAVFGLAAIYLPLSLQRRFMMGLFIPVAGLAAFGVENLARKRPGRYRLLTICIFAFSIPTNLIVLAAGFSGIQSHSSQIYLLVSESQALSWIKEHTDPDDLILSSPDMGLFIPAYTGRRVIYGHPYETVDAAQEEAAVLGYYQGRYSTDQANDFFQNRGVDYVFFGPREDILGDIIIFPEWNVVFDMDGVVLYQVPR